MTIDDKIRDEIIQYDSNRQAAKISASSSRKIDKYEFLTSEEILPFHIPVQEKLLENKQKQLRIKE